MTYAPPPALSAPATRWSLLAGGLVSVGLLVAIGWQLSRTSPEAIALLGRLSPAVAATFGLFYLAQPLADLAIYRRVWNLPLAGLGALMRKTAINEAVLGYGGELYLYVWARRRAGLAYAPFAAIKDVNILSSMVGFAGTLAALLAAAAWADSDELMRLLRPALWPAVGAAGVALVVLVFARRVFALRPADIGYVATIHAARLLATSALTVATWALALPEAPLQVWIVLLAVTLVGARVPFVTNKTLLVGNAVLLLLGPDSPFAVLLAAMAVATLALHLAVIAALGAGDLWRAVRPRAA